MQSGKPVRVGPFSYYEKDIIGRGSFGKVFLGKNEIDGQPIAIKVINVHKDPAKQKYMLKLIGNEIQALKNAKNENVVQFIDSFYQNNCVYIITEQCNEQDLKHLLAKHKTLDEAHAVKLVRQIVNGFKELCQKKIIHRDLKPANVLLHNGVAKIADFGFAKTLDFSVTDYNNQMTSVVGTPLYMSPQLLEKQKYTTKSDIWSLGIIFYEMLYGRVPWTGNDPDTYAKNIRATPLKFDDSRFKISYEVENFITKCLQVNEEDRFGWEELFQHPLISDPHSLSSTLTHHSENEDDGPSKNMRKYQTKVVNPSNMMKSYQSRVLQASRDTRQSINELSRTTIDQKLKHMSQVVPVSSSILTRRFTNGLSFNEITSGDGGSINHQYLRVNRFTSSHMPDSSEASPMHETAATKRTPSKHLDQEAEKEISKIHYPFANLRNKIMILEILYETIEKNEDIKEHILVKFNYLLCISRLINVYFRELSSQILTKKIKSKSAKLEDYYDSDPFKKLIVFCETKKRAFDAMFKQSSRKIFELKFDDDKERDEALDFLQEITAENSEKTLANKISEFSNRTLLSYNIKISGNKKNFNAKSKPSLQKLLNIFGADNFYQCLKENKAEDILSRVLKIREESEKK